MAKAIAPKVTVNAGYVDRRAELINRLNAEHPEYNHVFRDSRVSADDLEISGQELVKNNTYDKDGNAEVMKWRRDSIARMPRKEYDNMRETFTEDSAYGVKDTYKGKDSEDEWKVSDPGKKVATPKRPEDIDKEGGQ
jgi:hypothetical protein